jgi:hypothetical protein
VTMRRASVWIFCVNAIAVLVALMIYQHGGRDHFGERGFITFLSTFQLLVIAGLSHQIAKVKTQVSSMSKQSATLVWRVIAWGFVFLAADEFLSLHEVTDLFIHDLFNLQETGLTDRLDDLIMASYGMFGLGLLWVYRDEFKPYKSALAFFKKGFMLLFMMILLDLAANEQDLLELFFAPDTANTIQRHLDHVEDSLKVFAEAFFLVAFYSIRQTVKFRQLKLELSTNLLPIKPNR